MGKFWRLIGKGFGWLVRNPQAIEGAISIWQTQQQAKRPEQKQPVPDGPLADPPVRSPYIPCGMPGPDGLHCTLAAGHLGAHGTTGIWAGKLYDRFW
jgi:hypothetical protein